MSRLKLVQKFKKRMMIKMPVDWDDVSEADFMGWDGDVEYFTIYPDEVDDDEELKRDYYVITCEGKSSGKRGYLQDKAKGGYWTQYQSNARKFYNLKTARTVLKYIKFGNPEIAKIKGDE